MVQIGTILRSADNAGAMTYKCLTVFGGHRRRRAVLGNIVRIVPQEMVQNSAAKVKKKGMYYGLIVQSRQKTKRADGSSIKFQHNKVLALDDKQKLVGSRVYGVLCREVRNAGGEDNIFKKIISLSAGIV